MPQQVPLEILIRLKCCHPQTVATCLQCEGRGYVERWMALGELRTLPVNSWIILGKRRPRP